ncbi:DUF3888 domain-containing protein [Gottfriedia sp. NPDC058432]|uniref:DUF3888 domain-containing protein n=1 Tax=Gottfriedia sp. NPDC058432 TaxID=3346497 RepID=UPI0036508352
MKTILMLCMVIYNLFFFPYNTFAQNINDKDKDELITQFLEPYYLIALKKHFGSLYNISTQCERLIEIKRDPDRPKVFTVEAKTMTFEGAHNPPHYSVTIIVSNKDDVFNFKLINYKVEKTPLGTTCQNY